ncbi:MAG TPA: cupin domain-containing protein [Nitrospiraceae bacterium]|nr:cupin domain-containing protein [Nitrospiraceae bacterium]
MKGEHEAMVTVSENIPKKVVEAGSRTSMQILLGPDKTPNFAMRCFTIESGGSMPNHTNAVEHEQYVLAGRASVGIGEQVHEVKKGDVVFIPAGQPHWYKTEGNEAFQFLCLVPNQPDKIEILENR